MQKTRLQLHRKRRDGGGVGYVTPLFLVKARDF